MKILTALIAAAFCTYALAAPAMAADEAPAAEKKRPEVANTKHSAIKERRAECMKQAGGKSGIERKKFMRDCMHGTTGPTPTTKPAMAHAAATAKPAETAKPAKQDATAKPAEAPVTSHKDAYPAQRLQENPRLRARSCAMDADDKGLTGPDRQAFLRSCVKN